MKFSQARLITTSALLAALLVGCGGGGSDAPTTPAPGGTTSTTGTAGGTSTPGETAATVEASAKYVGTWAYCSAGEREVATISRVSANQFTFAFDLKQYSNANCTGSVTQQEAGSATATIAADTITVGGQTTDKIDVVLNSCSGPDCDAFGTQGKWISRATGTQLLVGFGDNSAYPTAFDTTYTKQ